ncbi:hypothetical protein COU78_00335 [Candidatus Peregrinibacteria bacterium CG10_big_fil_rev_8_21_14_0_10_49_24]|nr:MAG: hypothetical protein COV83_06380 [Candidatus Peregrinibacteria bacterium CG11_big_fil_rev_8_21_14_0_20_49_14]PIR51635.1 MAG: hypothetical protein COU78_00335 [Candidatus Peregrinibacteria bacterium CG10_big_fil_rev_8_21_14_0_10_49_24]PJA68005.1 MAG: hypothetical protein CO157_01625 [Candidatus Peregrinibacteria bacterium CG_4_9_14_3_um_filter_49_12]
MSLAFTLFVAGMLTILLPCILPLIPIVLGVSIAGRSKWRPLLSIAGMVVSFVGFTFLLLIVLRQFVEVADYMRIATYYVLLLFGLGFLSHHRAVHIVGAIFGAAFFLSKGYTAVAVAAPLGMVAMIVGGKVATHIQQFGSNVQTKTREELGEGSPLSAFIIGLTMGLVWVPCAGPALGFAFTLVREQPGLQAFAYLTMYGIGAALPLLIIGYGGQAAVHSVRALNKYSGYIKQVSGAVLIVTALAFQFHWFTKVETWFVLHTEYGTLGTRLEEKLFGDHIKMPSSQKEDATEEEPNAEETMKLPHLPIIAPVPEFVDAGIWHNSEPLTMQELRGKVVLVDFWTYSCINCIRTFPYMREYWDKYKENPFVLVGVHTPEFVFEKSEKNVADALRRYDLTYPVVQDNDYGIWRAFSNRYWPAKYLVDAEGNIRYTHFGEGEYEETDLAIQALLAEIGVDPVGTSPDTAPEQPDLPRTPETYLGARSWQFLGNGGLVPTEDVVTYKAPTSLEDNHYYLEGDWQLTDQERQVLRSDEGAIHMRFTGSEINLVMGVEEGASPSEVTVEVEGETASEFSVEYNDLFPLWKGQYGTYDIVIHVRGKGAEAYAFTFGVG